ncbi:MAG TPA: methyltransferase domain-containing protein [Jatrophihabitantaceae bacterium]
MAVSERNAAARATWALGDYHRFATDLIWQLGAELVAACGISAGDRVLDVAAGTGNTALRAAARGAKVVASDLTPENFAAGRDEARKLGVEVEWVEADAESLPFEDGEFDVVTSSVGAMWAPDHQAVADELVRVCRPGGVIGMVNFSADGLLSDFLDVFTPYLPPPPDAQSPTLWGSEDHLRGLFGDRVESLLLTPSAYLERVVGGPRGYCEYYKRTFGPVIALYAALAEQPERLARLDRDFLDFAVRANRGGDGDAAELRFEYLLVVAGKRRS